MLENLQEGIDPKVAELNAGLCFDFDDDITDIATHINNIIDEITDINAVGKLGLTSLHCISISRCRINDEIRLDIINKLISKGANPNIVDKSGLTALHYASTNKNLEVVKCLIENGAKVDLSVEFEGRAYPTVASYAKYQSGYLTNEW